MSGIYIHIPFCKKKCGYCDFYSIRLCKDSQLLDNFFLALNKEIVNKSYLFKNQTVETIYFGGGTPSLVPFRYLENVYQSISDNYHLANNIECTLEINPEQATDQYFSELKASGFVNRLSTGFQSMDNDCLKFLGRCHTVDDNYRYLDLCQKYGFDNFSVDYIFGYEMLTLKEIERSFKIFTDLKIPHISAYSLGIEQGTPFYLKLRKGEINIIDDEEYVSQFRLVHNLLTSARYEHYEISNYSLPEKYSKHNTNYWNFVPYLGFGPSAHSYYDNTRSWNIRDVHKYCDMVSRGEMSFEQEQLSKSDQFNEFIMLSLRTHRGIDLNHLHNQFSEFENEFYHNIKDKKICRYLVEDNGFVRLNLDGVMISDSIISELFA